MGNSNLVSGVYYHFLPYFCQFPPKARDLKLDFYLIYMYKNQFFFTSQKIKWYIKCSTFTLYYIFINKIKNIIIHLAFFNQFSPNMKERLIKAKKQKLVMP